MNPSITLLGTGGPRPDIARGATSLIEAGDEAILIDAGRGVVRQLAALNLPLPRIDPVLITHHHYDHIGELHDVILSSWLMGRDRPLRLYGPPETRRIVETLIHQIYDKDIEFRVHESCGDLPWHKVHTTDILAGPVCEGAGWRITADVVDHGNRLEFPDAFRQRWVCLGYRFEWAQGVIAFSGDTVDCPGLRRLAANADILVQCCYLARSEIATAQTRRLADYTLACADRVDRIATEANVGTLVLTHHRQKSDELLEQMRQDVARDFARPVLLGQDGLRISL